MVAKLDQAKPAESDYSALVLPNSVQKTNSHQILLPPNLPESPNLSEHISSLIASEITNSGNRSPALLHTFVVGNIDHDQNNADHQLSPSSCRPTDDDDDDDDDFGGAMNLINASVFLSEFSKSNYV